MLKLHKYQEEALRFALERRACYLALDLGMGKTAIALSLIKETKQPAFVFGPLRTIYSSWPDEIEKWAPELSYKIVHGKDKSLVDMENYDVILMNYEGLKWLSQQSFKWWKQKRTLILDESSMVKSHSTMRFKLLRKMKPLWNSYKLCLSATPAPNSLQELWSQYFLLDDGRALGKTITSFRDNYCRSFSYPGHTFTAYEIIPGRAKEIYDVIAPITYRLDANDHLDMPPITYNQIKCQLTPKLKKQYKQLEEDFFLEIEESEVEAPNTAILGMKLRQFVQGGLYDEDKVWNELHKIKLKALQELLETAAGKPILCAIQFKGELAMIRKALGEDVPVIAGGTSGKQAQTYIRQWNEGKLPILLCHPASLSHGVNLQHGGHLMLWYGLTWSLEQYSQLVGRLYRQGQRKHVIIHHLIMSGTIDEAVMAALSSKDATQKSLLNYIKAYRHN